MESPSSAVPPAFGPDRRELVGAFGRDVESPHWNPRIGLVEMHPNESLIRDGYDAFLRGDLVAVAEFLAPDVAWHVAGDSPLSGVYKGHEEVLGLFGRLFEMTGGTVTMTARDILASDDHTIVLTTLKASRGDEHLEDDGVAVFKIADGKATEIWVFAEDQAKMDAFFS